MSLGNAAEKVEAESLPALRLLLGQRSEEVLQAVGRHPGTIVFNDQLAAVRPSLPQAKLNDRGGASMLEHVVQHLVESGFQQHAIAPHLCLRVELQAKLHARIRKALTDSLTGRLCDRSQRNAHGEGQLEGKTRQ